ncbi:MAG: ankyrin repeat domain-containing protein, partial [Lentisphaeraceae bacterium]|nr:ankyrin repeat domain-containing protein [Lentisphaeraceae bacterium]
MKRLIIIFTVIVFVGIGLNAGEKLLEAVYEDQTNTALELLNSGSKANYENEYGVTPLSQACINGNDTLVKALIEKGADVNKSVAGESPLVIAAKTGKVSVLKLLIENGARIAKKSKNPT